MRIFEAIEISGSGLTAERFRLDVIANNLANVNTTRTPGGGPYRRKVPVFALREPAAGTPFEPAVPGGVRVVGVVEDMSPFKLEYNPGHPDADARGYVQLPNVDVVSEMVDMITATRAYEANVTALNAAKDMALKALDIGR